MREIASLHIGQCGVNIGAKFWKCIANEHGVNEDGIYTGNNDLQLDKISTYFTECDNRKFVPRSFFIDLESATVDKVLSSNIGKLFSPNKSITGLCGGSNNFAKGHYTDGAELVEPILEMVRKEIEICDCFQGFQVVHSLGGGCGSGLGSLILMKLTEEYTDRIIADYSIFPSPKVSDIVVEPYNATLAIHQLIEYSDFTVLLDNEALVNICHQSIQIPNPSYNDMNNLICFAMSGTTTCLRFPGQLNSDLRKIAMNMVPFPRLHFFMTGYAPVCSPHAMSFRTFSVTELMSQVFEPRNMMVACNPLSGKYLTAAAIFRGHISTMQVEVEILRMQNKNCSSFVQWLPHNIKAAICDIAPPGLKVASTFLANNTAMDTVLIRIAEEFNSMMKRKAFLHWFIGEGMEENEFLEAESNLSDLISEYQEYQIENP